MCCKLTGSIKWVEYVGRFARILTNQICGKLRRCKSCTVPFPKASTYLRNVAETYYILDPNNQEYILRLGDVNSVELPQNGFGGKSRDGQNAVLKPSESKLLPYAACLIPDVCVRILAYRFKGKFLTSLIPSSFELVGRRRYAKMEVAGKREIVEGFFAFFFDLEVFRVGVIKLFSQRSCY